ncbi:MAG: D-glycero-beta-D-manno-heptose-7-phosphate kinase [Deltaproteobacteria bacterium]|nr:D-glycero-beta-D-manno-heptose-7-phosphate kinase [Deltaproteobacteria bacterium]MBW2417263.1 D-glycero-beta-D-manno-heptose-7-phosphate kinase [Deltaproteobacteria bacterium]
MSRKTRPRIELKRLERLLDDFAQLRLLVVGDVVLDEYLWGDVDRISPEAPVPVMHVRGESVVLGGAGNVVRNVVALGARCGFASVVGEDPDGRRVEALLEELGVGTAGVVRDPGRPTTRKTRVVARSQQIVRVDRETRQPLAPGVARGLLAATDSLLEGADGVVLEDYGKGLLNRRLIRQLMTRFEGAGVPVTVDPKEELGPFRGAALLKPNLREAEKLTGIRVRERADLERIARRLRTKVGDADLVITRGGEGMTLFQAGRPAADVPTVPQEVFDVQGAGDTTIAILTLALRAGASLVEAAVLANAGAGVVVEKTGTATASRDEVRALLPAAIRAAGEGA